MLNHLEIGNIFNYLTCEKVQWNEKAHDNVKCGSGINQIKTFRKEITYLGGKYGKKIHHYHHEDDYEE